MKNRLDVFATDFKKYFLFLLYAYAFFIPFKMILANIVSGLLLIAVLAFATYSPKSLFRLAKKEFIIGSSLFILQLIYLLFSDNLSEGIFLTEIKLTIFIFPLVFSICGHILTKEEHFKILDAFLFGILLSLCYCFGHAFYLQLTIGLLPVNWALFSDTLLDPSGISHVYFGIYCAFGISLLVYKQLQFGKLSKLNLLELSVMILFMVFVVPKMALLALFVSLIYMIVSNREQLSKTALTYILIMFLLFFACVFLLPKSYQRIRQFTFGYARENMVNDINNYSANRTAPLYCSLDLLKDNWISGFGVGELQSQMNIWYKEHGLDQLVNYNTHNQYLDYILTFGILGLLLLLFNLGYSFYLSFKYNLRIYSVLTFILSLSFLTETVLGSNKGVIFFAFMNSLFMSYLNQKEENVT